MYYLVYTKQQQGYGTVGLVCREFKSRKEVLLYAIDTHIRLNGYDTVIIGPDGVERGSADPYEELEKITLSEAKEKVEVVNG